MKYPMKNVAGIDVGKNRLDVCLDRGLVEGFENTAQGIARLVKCLHAGGAEQVVLEASGGYERFLLDELRAAGIQANRVQPSRVRAFAHALGVGAKTDALDARLLCVYGQSLELPGNPSVSLEVRHLREQVDRREQLMVQRVEEMNRLEKNPPAWVRASCRRHMAWLSREIKRIDTALRSLLKEGELAERAALLRSVKGVGEVTVGVLLAHLPELGEGFWQVLERAGGFGAVGARQWSASRQTQHSGWPQGGAPCVVYVGAVVGSSRPGDAEFLPGIAGPGQAGQGGLGGGDAQEVVASACDCPERYAVGGDPGARSVKKQ